MLVSDEQNSWLNFKFFHFLSFSNSNFAEQSLQIQFFHVIERTLKYQVGGNAKHLSRKNLSFGKWTKVVLTSL